MRLVMRTESSCVNSVRAPSPATHRLFSEIRTDRMARADLKELEVATHRQRIGRCVELARKALGWSQKELAAALGDASGELRDVAQISRWESGKERPQFDVLWAVPAMRGQLVIALADLTEDIDIETTIRVRRTS